MEPTTLLEKAKASRLVFREDEAVIKPHLDEAQLTFTELLLLEAVAKGPKEGVSMSTAADALGVTLPQITALANKLLALKLVTQKVQVHDRRSRHLYATKKGRDLYEASKSWKPVEAGNE